MKRLKILFILLCAPLFLWAQNNNPGFKNEPNDPATVTYKRKVPPSTEKKNNATTTNTPLNQNSQTKTQSIPQPAPEKLDTIVRMGGKKIICTVKKINPTSVEYVKPESPVQLEMRRKDIEKIIFRNGRKEIFNKPVFSMIDKTQWEAVMVTENEGDVEGLFKRGVVKATASSGSRSPKAAKTSATIRLQKKTANMGALIVLVVRSEMKGGYGEIPGWELEGIAYSDTPPADTATVNAAIRKMIERNRQRISDAKLKK